MDLPGSRKVAAVWFFEFKKSHQKSHYTMTVTVTFSGIFKKITPKVTLHCDGYCDFLRDEVNDRGKKPRHFENSSALFFKSQELFKSFKLLHVVACESEVS